MMAASTLVLDTLQSVRFVDAGDRRLAVLDADDWEALIEWLEGLEDAGLARRAFDQLRAAGGDRRAAGWREWPSIKQEIA
jgi:hypothetical protein